MATTYYCDLGQDFDDKTGADNTGNQYLGPGGFQAAIEGWGNATALVKGDVLLTKGTGDLSKLVKITVDVDKSGTWVISDVVQNHNDGGGVSGDDWVGELVFIDATTLWVQINAASTDIDSVDAADGVDNTTRTETIAGANMMPAAAPGIQLDNGQGAQDGDGMITLRGVDSSWNILNSGGAADTSHQAILDGNSKAVNCMLAGDKDYFHLDCLTFYRAAQDGLDTDGVGSRSYWRVHHCLFNSNGADGWNMDNDFVVHAIRCIFRSNGTDGVGGLAHGVWINCVFADNTGYGLSGLGGGTMVNCLVEGNGGAGQIEMTQHQGVVTYSVIATPAAGNVDGIVVTAHRVNTIFGNRICNHTDAGEYGITCSVATVLCFEDWNVLANNAGGDLNNVTGGINSYGDHGNHIADPGADDGMDADFNVEDGKEHDSTELILNWDE